MYRDAMQRLEAEAREVEFDVDSSTARYMLTHAYLEGRGESKRSRMEAIATFAGTYITQGLDALVEEWTTTETSERPN